MLTDKMDIGGAETHILTLINELERMNIDITLISAGGIYINDNFTKNIRYIFAPLDKRDVKSIAESLKIIRFESRFHDIIHAHTRFTAYLAKKSRGTSTYPPIVTTAHLNFPLFPFGPISYWGDKTLAVSEDIKEYLKRFYRLKDRNVFLTKNSIDYNLYTTASPKEKNIIHTSRIDKGRSLTAFLLLESAKTIIKNHKDWRIIIVGYGNMYTKLCKSAESVNKFLGFEGVKILGKRNDIPDILRLGSIFVGVSRSALEGMSCGIATIICGDEGYGGILCEDNFKELFKSNFCARGFKKASKKLLIKDIEYLINNQKKRNDLSLFSRSIIEK